MQFRRSVNHAAGLICQPCTRAVPGGDLTKVGAVGRAIDGGRSAAALLKRPQHNPTLCRLRWPRVHSQNNALMAPADEHDLNPFSSVGGNILFGGLPRRCGPEIAITHLERVAALGAQVEISARLVERTVKEFQRPIDLSRRAEEVLSRVFGHVVEERMPADPISEQFSFAEWLQEHLFDESLVAAQHYGIVLEVDRPEAFLAVASFFAGPPDRSVADLLELVHASDRKRWNIPDPWSEDHLTRACGLSTQHLLLGLHELDRIPWGQFGGMVAGRGVSDDYLGALRALNRDVILAHILHGWHNSANERVEHMSEALNDLIGVSLPFALPPQLSRLLSAVSRLYLHGEYAASVILARSTLEPAIAVTRESLDLAPEKDLATQVTKLRKIGVLSHAHFRAASDVRVGGNEAVHKRYPDYHNRAQALRALKALVDVLAALRSHIEVSGNGGFA